MLETAEDEIGREDVGESYSSQSAELSCLVEQLHDTKQFKKPNEVSEFHHNPISPLIDPGERGYKDNNESLHPDNSTACHFSLSRVQ